MTTDLPIGSIVRYKYKGDWEYAEVQEAGVRLISVWSVTEGTPLHDCVWKGDTLVSRRLRKHRVEL